MADRRNTLPAYIVDCPTITPAKPVTPPPARPCAYAVTAHEYSTILTVNAHVIGRISHRFRALVFLSLCSIIMTSFYIPLNTWYHKEILATLHQHNLYNGLVALPTPSTPPPPLSISAEELVEALRPHLLSLKRMRALGYPLEIYPNSLKAVFYINPPRRRSTLVNLDVDDGSQGDSACGLSERAKSVKEEDTVERILCVRCDKMFKMTREGEYLKNEPCVHHWGRVNANCYYTCCNSPWGARGCSTAPVHVWNGTRRGMNGPLDGFVRARSPRGGVYAIDTEMCYTTAGLELASVVVVAADGRPVYTSLVKPSAPVVDYNTRFSGITPQILAGATKTLGDVQNDILQFVGTDTILIGHALENDLRALKLLHGAVVDTCVLYPHERGFPRRRSLRELSEEYLGRSVQTSSSGHSPLEDARAAMDLVLLKVFKERAHQTRISALLSMPQPYNPLIMPPHYWVNHNL